MQWILILTIFYNGESTHIHSVEFSNKQQCEIALKAWVKSVNDTAATASGVAICVQR